MQQKLYDTKGAVEFFKKLGVSFRTGTLNSWRCRDRGPKYIKIGKKVYYDEGHLLSFINGVPYNPSESVSPDA